MSAAAKDGSTRRRRGELLVAGLIFLAGGARLPARSRPEPLGALRLERVPGIRLELGGRLGERIERNVRRWLLPAPVANPGLVEMFRRRDRAPAPDLVPWAGEFVGKYLLSAIGALRLGNRPELERTARAVVTELIASQADDGYLGPFPRSERFLGHWDLWGHYHVLLALLAWHEHSGEEEALAAASRAAELACRTFLDTGRRPIDAGSPEMNLALIHALGRLYLETGEARLRRLMAVIEEDEERAGDYFRQGLAGVDFFRTPRPRWESLHDIQGLVELFRITGDARYRRAFENLWESIARRDRHNTGGFSSGERAVGHPWSPAAIETCCTVAWIALSVDMLRLSGDPRVADELELSTLNAALGAQHPSGRWWTYNTPMDGERRASAHSIVFQARAGTPELNCCSVNGPRALAMLADWAVMRERGTGAVVINAFGPGRATLPLEGGARLVLVQDAEATTYPRGPDVLLRVEPSGPRELELALRVPGWSRSTRASVNGEPVPTVEPGRYLRLRRLWRAGDTVALRFDLRLRVEAGDRALAGRISLRRGPLLLAWDPRWNEHDEEEIPALDAEALEGLEATPRPAPALVSPLLAELDPWLLVPLPGAGGRTALLCDFASAGATGARYRSWLPARNAPPPPVLLDAPRRGESTGSGRIVFRWSGCRPRPEGARLWLQVARGPGLRELLVDRPVEEDLAVPELSFAAGEYFWRVVARAHGRSTPSEVRRFRVDPLLPALSEAEIEALLPGPGGLILDVPLDGSPRPKRGRLQDARGWSAGGAEASGSGGGAPGAGAAVRLDGRAGRLRYAIDRFPAESFTARIEARIDALPEGRIGQVLSAWAAGMDDPLRLTVEGNRLSARVEAGRAYATAGVEISPGRWYCLVAVKEGARLRLFVDGGARVETAVPRRVESAATNLALGGNPNFSGNEFLAVSVRGFRLWNRSLGEEEVRRASREQ